VKYLLRTAALILFAAIAAHAESPLQIEVIDHGGIPLNDTLRNATSVGSAANFVHIQTDRAPYITGVSAGVLLRDRLHVAFGAVYMPVSYTWGGQTCCPVSWAEAHTRGTSWEFPLLGHYRWGSGDLRPLSGGGFVLHNRTSGVNKQPLAPVVSGGVEWSRGLMAIRPELRYVHFPYRYVGIGIDRPPNQFQLLIGVGFRKPRG